MTAQTEHTDFTIQLDVSFRKLREDDLPKIEWYGEFKHFRQLFRRSYDGQLKGHRLMLVADVNNFPIGRLFIQYGQKGRSRLSDGHSKGYLYSFHLMDMFQGKGIGTRLIHRAEEILIQKNYSWVTISVTKDNDGALRLYQGQGYSIFGEDDGKWHYHDHRGIVRYVHEPSFLLKKRL